MSVDKPLVPADLLDRVVAYFQPRRVILFGSTARGEAGIDPSVKTGTTEVLAGINVMTTRIANLKRLLVRAVQNLRVSDRYQLACAGLAAVHNVIAGILFMESAVTHAACVSAIAMLYADL